MNLRPTTKRALAAWSMTSPGILGLILFIFFPFSIAVILSFTNYRFNSPLPFRWLGIENYLDLINQVDFLRAILNNLIFTSLVVPLQTSLALILALLVNQQLRGMIVFRTLFFLPVIYPMALVSVVWALIFAPGQVGLMNQFLGFISFGQWDFQIDFLRNPFLALPCIVVMSIWQGVGFQMVILLAALQGIPETLYESARIDRAGLWSRFLHITLPQLRNSLIFVAMVTTILAFRLFDQVWILTRGGPNNATTTVMYEAFLAARERNQIGLGSAMTVIFFIMVGLIAFLQHFGIRQRREVNS
jgi:multiple sugar transport system permease protein